MQSHVSQLRRILGRDAVLARSRGYLLDLGGEGTDALAAERLVREGTRATDPVAALAALRAATARARRRTALTIDNHERAVTRSSAA